MLFKTAEQAQQEIVSEDNVRYTKQNLRIMGREPNLRELQDNYRRYNIVIRTFSVVSQDQQVNSERQVA